MHLVKWVVRKHITHCWGFLVVIEEEHSSSEFCPIHSKFLLERRKCEFVKVFLLPTKC